jgi:hypothetical protein
VPPGVGLLLVLGVGQDSCGEFLLAVEAEHKTRPAGFNRMRKFGFTYWQRYDSMARVS